MAIEQPFPAAGIPDAAFPLRGEALLDEASRLMARGWPLVVTAVYLDCALAILRGTGSPQFAQIVWHLLAIGLTHGLAMIGTRGLFPAGVPAGPARAWIESACLAALALLLLAVAVAACTSAPVAPLPLHWPVRLVVVASSLLLGFAALARLNRLRPYLNEISATH